MGMLTTSWGVCVKKSSPTENRSALKYVLKPVGNSYCRAGRADAALEGSSAGVVSDAARGAVSADALVVPSLVEHAGDALYPFFDFARLVVQPQGVCRFGHAVVAAREAGDHAGFDGLARASAGVGASACSARVLGRTILEATSWWERSSIGG